MTPLPEPKIRVSSLRQPGHPDFRIRGFASPDCSGFALSEFYFLLCAYQDTAGLFKNLPIKQSVSRYNQPPENLAKQLWKQKGHPPSAEDERPCITPLPEPKIRVSSLRQPGYPDLRTRSFAPPDYSGFALSEFNLFFKTQRKHFVINKFEFTELNLFCQGGYYEYIFGFLMTED